MIDLELIKIYYRGLETKLNEHHLTMEILDIPELIKALEEAKEIILIKKEVRRDLCDDWLSKFFPEEERGTNDRT